MSLFGDCGVNKGQDSLHIRHRDHMHSGMSIVLDSPTPSPIPNLRSRSRLRMGVLENRWLVEEDHPLLSYHDAELVELYSYSGQWTPWRQEIGSHRYRGHSRDPLRSVSSGVNIGFPSAFILTDQACVLLLASSVVIEEKVVMARYARMRKREFAHLRACSNC